MKCASPQPSIDLLRFLSKKEWDGLGPPQSWQWIASIGTSDKDPIRHRRHQQWIKDPEHIWRPDHRDVMLTLRGEAVYGFNGKVYQREPGTVMLFDHGESRDFRGALYQRQQAFSCLWLHLHDAQSLRYQIRGVDQNGQRSVLLPMRIKSDRSAMLITTAWDRCREIPGDPLAWMYLKAIIGSILLEILATTTGELPPHHHQQIVLSMQRYIDRNVSGDLSLRHLAKTAGYSPSFFHRIFRLHAGQTPQEYIDTVRLEKAKELLRTGHTVESVAELVGMASVSYFRRFFKQRMRRPPKQWSRMEEVEGNALR